MVLNAGRREEPLAARALEELCRTYWYPLYAYVRTGGRAGIDLHATLGKDTTVSLETADSVSDFFRITGTARRRPGAFPGLCSHR